MTCCYTALGVCAQVVLNVKKRRNKRQLITDYLHLGLDNQNSNSQCFFSLKIVPLTYDFLGGNLQKIEIFHL